MFSKKYSQTIFMIIMAFGMSLIMSGVVTAASTGFGVGFLERYLNSFIFALPIGLIAAFAMGPIAKIIVKKLISND